MATVEFNGARVTDWDSFHDESKRAFGFPEFYGRNGNAWIDCLTYLRAGDGMAAVVLGPNECLDVVVQGARAFEAQAPDVLTALVSLTADVNQRCIEAGEPPVLRLIYR